MKSDTGRVRVGCKRDPDCPFVVRCNWERKNGREPLARVTVLRNEHTCLDNLPNSWGLGGTQIQAQNALGGQIPGMGGDMNVEMQQPMEVHELEIRTDENGNIIPGARVLGPLRPPPRPAPPPTDPSLIPVLPKVQRNSASRLPFLMEILPRLMRIEKETTPVEIRECLLREYGQEVHLQQCRRAKTEILKRRAASNNGQNGSSVPPDSADANGESVGSSENGGNDETDMFGLSDTRDAHSATPNAHSNPHSHHHTPNMLSSTPQHPQNSNLPNSALQNGNLQNGSLQQNGTLQMDTEFPLHTASGVVIPQVTTRREAVLNAAVGEAPVRCPYCVNHRWMKTVKDAVEHMSMHVVV